MIGLLARAQAERRNLGYVTDATRERLAAIGCDGFQLERFLIDSESN